MKKKEKKTGKSEEKNKGSSNEAVTRQSLARKNEEKPRFELTAGR